MRSRALFFVVVLLLAVSVLSLFFFISEGGFEGRGHGAGGGGSTPSIWLGLFAAPLIVVVAVLGYSFLFPELSKDTLPMRRSATPTTEVKVSSIDAVLRVLKDDERQVIETLVAEGGTMLQKDIRWKTGFSRVKTHRILFRLAERGIVSAEKHYNTNKITLTDWLSTKEKSTVA